MSRRVRPQLQRGARPRPSWTRSPRRALGAGRRSPRPPRGPRPQPLGAHARGRARGGAEAAFRSAREAVARIDLPLQRGEHPRIGAVNVIPFVPLEGATLELAAEVARRTGERLARELGCRSTSTRRPRPGPSASRSRTCGTASRRSGASREPSPRCGRPTLGPGRAPRDGRRRVRRARASSSSRSTWTSRARTSTLAQEIASRVREVRRGRRALPAVRAKGFRLASQGRVQVSCNLVDYRRDGRRRAFREIERLALEHGVTVARSELVGLVPHEALEQAGAELLRLEGFRGAERVLEQRLARALPPTPSGELPRYLEAIAAPGHSPGGGSAGALAAALGQACLEKARAFSSARASSARARSRSFENARAPLEVVCSRAPRTSARSPSTRTLGSPRRAIREGHRGAGERRRRPAPSRARPPSLARRRRSWPRRATRTS